MMEQIPHEFSYVLAPHAFISLLLFVFHYSSLDPVSSWNGG